MIPALEPVHVQSLKWPDHPHWEYRAKYLGEDEHGTWLGAGAGCTVSRPGAAFVTDRARVALVPRTGAFVATFHEPGGIAPFDLYVDITTVPVWAAEPAGRVVQVVDLDLDVLRGRSGRVWVDDEDEFADHRVRLAYPAEVVRLAVSSCAAVLAAVSGGRPPYDGSAGSWFAALADAAAEPSSARVSDGGGGASSGPASARPGAGRPAGSPAGRPRA